MGGRRSICRAVETVAWKINVAGAILGAYVAPDGQEQLFVSWLGRLKAIPLPNGKPVAEENGSNALGDMVGIYCDDAPPCEIAPTGTHGFLMSQGDFTSIDFPGSTATSIIGINVYRDIVGAYFDADGHLHGFLRDSGSHAGWDGGE